MNAEITEPCTLGNIALMQDVTEYWSVTADGEPDVQVGDTDQADFIGYVCRNCGAEFDTWEEVKAHIAN